MRQLLLFVVVSSAGCLAGEADDPVPDPDTIGQGCPMPEALTDTGVLAATKAQMCNVSGSMGRAHWYKLAAVLPGSMNYVELDLWDQLGAFAGAAVHTGTFTIAGADADPDTCGVCVRGLGNKGISGTKEYFATSGTVIVTELGGDGAPISATLSNVSFVEIDAATHNAVSSGCTASLAGARLAGMVTVVGGGGGGGGGGGAGGTGQCLPGIGD